MASPLPDQIWFDPANPDPLHEALRADYARTRPAAERRPSLRRHMSECPDCQAIAAAVVTAPNPMVTRKRIKLVLTKELMHRVLRLPAHFEIVHMFADNDPNAVSVLVAGEGLPETPADAETPIAAWDAVARDTTHRQS